MATVGWSRYLAWMVVTTLATVVLCAALNAFIDPLGVFDSPRIKGINGIKPYIDHDRELSRFAAARRLCASAGIFGNSRAEVGFDPESPTFHRRGLEAFNHAIPGTSVTTAYRQLSWLEDIHCAPRAIVLGVDFFDFLGAEPGAAPLAASAPAIDARFLASTVFSLAGLRDSMMTFVAQRAQYPATITPRGFNPLLNYIREVDQGGHYVLFRQRAEENLKRWTRTAPRLRPAAGVSSDYAGLEAFLDRATASASTVRLVIYPYHAETRMLMERIGLGEIFAQWKASMLDTARKHSRDGIEVAVWDFSAITAESLEPIPAPGDRHTNLRYYWEAGHFKPTLGEKMLTAMFEHDNSFGVLLTPNNVEQWLATDRRRVLEELSKRSALLDEVDDLLRRRSDIR